MLGAKIKSFYKRDWVCAVWIIFLKTLRNWHNRQMGSGRPLTLYCQEHSLMQSMILWSVRRVNQRHKTVASQQSWPKSCGLQDMVSAAGMQFIRSQWRTLIWWAEAASAWSMVRNPTECHWSVARTSQCVCVSKPKANTLNICRGVFVHNCQFVMMFNACITVLWLWTEWRII